MIKNVILDKNLIGNRICYRRRLLLAIGDGWLEFVLLIGLKSYT